MKCGGKAVNKIKKIPQKDMDDFTTIAVNAYPGMKIVTDEEKRKLKRRLIKIDKEDPVASTYGVYRRGRLVGGAKFFDFTMTLFSTKTMVGGIGFVAVDLAHKKEKVARELMLDFLHHYRKKGACLTALYPFRPDFYKKMGFGYGTKMNHYRIKPSSLPTWGTKAHISFLTRKDRRALTDCYNRYVDLTHGMMRKCKFEIMRFDRPNVKVIGYKKGRKILGYIAFEFKPYKKDNFISNDLGIIEFIYENRNVLSELVTFLRTQADQVNHILYNSQDDNFHYLLSDPRHALENLQHPLSHETNMQGLGIMYRIIDTKSIFRILKNHNFGSQNCGLKLTISDSFLPENEGSYIIHFTDGKARLKKAADYEVEIQLDVSDFSSLLLGVVDFKSLYNYGAAEISRIKYIDTVNRIFLAEKKPVCTTQF